MSVRLSMMGCPEAGFIPCLLAIAGYMEGREDEVKAAILLEELQQHYRVIFNPCPEGEPCRMTVDAEVSGEEEQGGPGGRQLFGSAVVCPENLDICFRFNVLPSNRGALILVHPTREKKKI